VYIAVMNQAGHYNYSNAATLFTLSDIGLSAHRYHNRLDIFTQSLENGAAQSGVDRHIAERQRPDAGTGEPAMLTAMPGWRPTKKPR
jgi:hypothetical protein